MLRLHTGCMVARQVCLARYLMSRWQMHRFDHPQRDVNEPLTTVDKLICLNALQGPVARLRDSHTKEITTSKGQPIQILHSCPIAAMCANKS
eukprot:66924-Pelagomonas_calceolata.AAC.9